MRNKSNLSFSEYIKQLPPALVFDNLLDESEERRILSSGYISEICESFAQKDALNSRFASLSDECRIACALAYLCGSTGLQSAGLGLLHEELLSSFLVYAAHDKSGNCYYLGFDDLDPLLRGALAATLSSCAESYESVAQHLSESTRQHILNDIATVAACGSQGQVKRTQNGRLARASANLVHKLVHPQPSSATFISKYEDPRTIPELLVEHCLDTELFFKNGSECKATLDTTAQWLSHSNDGNLRALCEFAFGWIGGWRIELVKAVLNACGEEWMSTALFPESQREHVHKALHVLNYIGIAEVAQDSDGLLWRGTQSNGIPERDEALRQEENITVLPDFTAILAQETSPGSICTFCTFGELVSLDRVYKGELNRTVLNNTLASGLDANRVVESLERWRAPGNVVQTVREWIREFQRLYVASEQMVLSFDERTSKELRSFGPLQELATPIDAHSVFAITKGKEKQVWDLLSSIGYDPRLPRKVRPPEPDASDLHKNPGGNELETVLEFEKPASEETTQVRSGKYGAELKELDINEIYHVIDYALLMGLAVRFEYAGSPHVRKGVYEAVPTALKKGAEPVLEVTMTKNKRKREFSVRAICKIGVRENGDEG